MQKNAPFLILAILFYKIKIIAQNVLLCIFTVWPKLDESR